MELCTKAATFEDGRAKESWIVRLQNFLEEAALFTDADKNTDQKGVTLMTIHASKGMEFDTVILAGMENDLLPHKHCETAEETEEEKTRIRWYHEGKEESVSHLCQRTVYLWEDRKKYPQLFLL